MSQALTKLPTAHPAEVSHGAVLYRVSTEAAALCRDIVVATSTNIQGRKYVAVEGWQAIALAHGCAASSGDVVQHPDGSIAAIGRVYKVDTGDLVASAEGYVGADEATWFGGTQTDRYGKVKVLPKRPDYAIRAMAQTRAISRACRSAFAHVVVMMNAGLSTTPAEEAPDEGFEPRQRVETPPEPRDAPPRGDPPREPPATVSKALVDEAADLLEHEPDAGRWLVLLERYVWSAVGRNELEALWKLPSVRGGVAMGGEPRAKIVKLFADRAARLNVAKEPEPETPTGEEEPHGPAYCPNDAFGQPIDGVATDDPIVYANWFAKAVASADAWEALIAHNLDTLAAARAAAPAAHQTIELALALRRKPHYPSAPPQEAAQQPQAAPPPDLPLGPGTPVVPPQDRAPPTLPIPLRKTPRGTDDWDRYCDQVTFQLQVMQSADAVIAWTQINGPTYSGKAADIKIERLIKDRLTALRPPPPPDPDAALVQRVQNELLTLDSVEAITAWSQGPIRPEIMALKTHNPVQFDVVRQAIDQRGADLAMPA